jgi:Fusaric acid resistance protein-like
VAGPAESPAGASPRLSRVLGRRAVAGVVVIALLGVPFAVLAVLSGQSAASWAMFSALATLTVLLTAGQEYAYLTVGLLTALTPVAIVSGAVPVAGAALMALMCLGVGVSAHWGLQRAMLNIPIYIAFIMIAPPPWTGQAVDRTTTSYLLWNMLSMGGGALWAALVFPPLLRKRKISVPLGPPKPWARPDVVAYTITITVLCSACTLAILAWWPGSDLGWLPITVLAVSGFGFGAGTGTTVKRSLSRIGGTIIGFAFAALVASVVDSEAVLIGIVLILGIMVVVVALSVKSYLLFEAFVVPFVVLAAATSIADVDKTDAERLAAVVIGGALVLLATGITLSWAHYQQAHSPSVAAVS